MDETSYDKSIPIGQLGVYDKSISIGQLRV